MATIRRSDSELISGINVTPLVDVVLVLLVVLMVTASYIADKTIPVDLPSATTGEATATTLVISIDGTGQLYLEAQPVDRTGLRERLRRARSENPDTRALVAADGAVRHRQVVGVVDLMRQEGVTRFAIDIQPEGARGE